MGLNHMKVMLEFIIKKMANSLKQTLIEQVKKYGMIVGNTREILNYNFLIEDFSFNVLARDKKYIEEKILKY